jgi:hypothetical protein
MTMSRYDIWSPNKSVAFVKIVEGKDPNPFDVRFSCAGETDDVLRLTNSQFQLLGHLVLSYNAVSIALGDGKDSSFRYFTEEGNQDEFMDGNILVRMTQFIPPEDP